LLAYLNLSTASVKCIQLTYRPSAYLCLLSRSETADSETVASRIDDVHLFVCLSVAKMQKKRDFLKN